MQCKAQNSSLIHYLLQRISSSQKNKTTTPGNFPSYISGKTSLSKQPDDNVFFAALINYLLERNQSVFSIEDKIIIDSIFHKSKTLYPHFQSRNGRLTYNFWRTDTIVPFRYTKWIRLVKKNTSLPDDMDDTVLSLMAQSTDSATAAKAHVMMQAYINTNNHRKTVEKKYRMYKAYSTWYGKNFPPVFDVCVLCNVLSFVQQYHLAWTAADSASLAVIKQAIVSGDYITKPLSVSPYYGNTSIILYHLARLMEYGNIPTLDSLKTEMISTSVQRWSRTNDLLEKIILSTSIMKWGYNPPSLSLVTNEEAIQQVEKSPLPFFTGNIPSYFPPFYKQLFTQKKWLLFYHYSPSFNDALLVEYLSLLHQDQ